MKTIPLQPIPAQTLQIVLDGQYCTFSVYYRWGRCYLDLTVGATPILKGILCLHGEKLNTSPNIDFSGSLYFVDTQAQEPPQWEGLGDRWVLVYLSEGENAPDTLGNN
jgi:hypothetical protein